MPGDRYFDNYDLTVLDNADFYADGRDLGENYTYTGWMMNKCAENSEFHCVTCHTSSGRDRFKNNPNDACKKCHEERVANVAEHSGHKPDSKGSVCINCHMPKTMFGSMNRSDHSFRPPMPEATIRFSSPNACNMCHTDKTPQWANNVVKKRKNGNYQNETIAWATLLNSARKDDWRRLDDMLQIIRKNELNQVVVASFVRVLDRCAKPEKWPVIIEALQNPSPLVRASAANGLVANNTDASRTALVKAAADEYRLVRVAAAYALSQFPAESFSAADKTVVDKATAEYLQSMVTRPDDWSSHYNLGLFYQNRGENDKALGSYESAARLYPESLMPLINSSVLYSYVGNPAKAEENLKRVLEIDPLNEAANLNYGLLLAENGRIAEAEQALKKALQANPAQAVAAYNLSVIVSQRSINEAVDYAKIAATANQQEPKYAYTLAFYQLQNNQKSEAIKTLKAIIQSNPQYINAVSLLADTYARDGKPADAIKVYQQALKSREITEQDRTVLMQAIAGLQQSM
jgi:tetratricopeptide (TPR) repeat protein